MWGAWKRLYPVSTINAARWYQGPMEKFSNQFWDQQTSCDLSMTMYQPLHCQHTQKKKGIMCCQPGWTTNLDMQPISIPTAKIRAPPNLGYFMSKFCHWKKCLTESRLLLNISTADQHKACHCPKTCSHWTDRIFKGPVLDPMRLLACCLRVRFGCCIASDLFSF